MSVLNKPSVTILLEIKRNSIDQPRAKGHWEDELRQEKMLWGPPSMATGVEN